MRERRSKIVNLDDIITRLQNCEEASSKSSFPLQLEEIESLCLVVKSILIAQPMLLELEPPLIVCGDIHGQYNDLLSIFNKMGEPGDRNYLFLGDYVDRGKRSLECYCLLMAFKIKFPLNFFLLRGNHESCDLNKIYGFYDECKRKFNVKLWKTVADTFDYLPVAAVVGNRIFCVHGGLSPLLRNLQLLNNIKRPIMPSQNRLICDLLWSDPTAKFEGWSNNFQRGVSFVYGSKVIDKFLQDHDFDLICRSHQVVEEGYQFFHSRKLLTLFSAPNYCGQFQNFGGILLISKDMVCSLSQLKGSTINHRRIIRSATPIAARSESEEVQQKENKQKNCKIMINKGRRKVTAASTQLAYEMRLAVQQQALQPVLQLPDNKRSSIS